MNEPEYLYRYEAHWTFDWYRDHPKLELLKLPVLKHTRCGVWVYHAFRKRWVSQTSRKRFAHATEEDALLAYYLRKRSYVSHAKARYEKAKDELALCGIESPHPKVRGFMDMDRKDGLWTT